VPAGTPATRYYYIQNGDDFDLYDGQGKPVQLTAGNYKSGNATVAVVAGAGADDPSVITGPIDTNAAFKNVSIPTGGELIGQLNETDAAGDITNTFYYRVVEGAFVWTDADGN